MCALVTAEGDLGTALIIAGLLVGMLWVAGMQGKQVALIAGAGAAAAVGLICSSAERMSRIFAFLHPSADPGDTGYQLTQSLVALGRGGWFGVGPGESIQKFQYLPKAHTDMIFSILGEEFGLVGSLAVLALFVVFAVACWKLARRCAEPLGQIPHRRVRYAGDSAGDRQYRRSDRGHAAYRRAPSFHQLRTQQPGGHVDGGRY